MERRRGEDLPGEFKQVERGWCLGGDQFRQELLEEVETRPGPSQVSSVGGQSEPGGTTAGALPGPSQSIVCTAAQPRATPS
jgi:hypothetical protein